MSTVFGTIVTALLFVAVLLLHEMGHLFAYRRRGFPIIEMGLGMKIPPQVTIRSRYLPFPFALSPWLLGAYVLPEQGREEEIERLPYRDRATMYGAGVVVNFVIAGAGLALYSVMKGALWLAGASLVCAVAITLARRFFCAYIIPVLGVAGIAFFAYVLTQSVGKAQGPVGLAELAVNDSFSGVVLKVTSFSLALGLTNAMPLFPLDGGRVADAALRQVAGRSSRNVLKGVTAGILLALFVYSFASDIISLVR